MNSDGNRDISPVALKDILLVVLLATAIVYGIFVECRALYTHNHNTDLGVYLAAAQAIREGGDPYTATYNHDHYMYPPFLAILMARLAPDPPQPDIPSGPAFAWTVGLWYFFSVAVLLSGVFILFRQLCLYWPARRVTPAANWSSLSSVWLLPLFLCLHCLGRELQLGQVDVFLMFALIMMTYQASRQKSLQAGLWMALGICLKPLPLMLLIYPLWRRDWRWLSSCLCGIILGTLVLPVITIGWTATVKYSGEYARVMILPGLTGNVTDHSRDEELFNQNATHNHSILGVIHSLQNISTPRQQRPKVASSFSRLLADAIGGGLILATMLATGFKSRISPRATLLCLSLLMTLMIIANPVCQTYYFVMLIPLLMALVAENLWRRSASFPGRGICLAFLAYPLAMALASYFPLIRDTGWLLASVLLLCGLGWNALRQETKTTPVPDP